MEPEDGESNFLKHYGVKGQKWGQRRIASSSNTNPNRRRIKLPPNYKSKKLAQASLATALGAVGAFTIGRVSGDTTTKLGATLISGILTGTSAALLNASDRAQAAGK